MSSFRLIINSSNLSNSNNNSIYTYNFITNLSVGDNEIIPGLYVPNCKLAVKSLISFVLKLNNSVSTFSIIQ